MGFSTNCACLLYGLHAVLEVYSEWSGMCKSVLPLFRKIRLDKDDECALMFLAVSAAGNDLHPGLLPQQ